MKKYRVFKTIFEMANKNYKSVSADAIETEAAMSDDLEVIGLFDTIEEAKASLKGKRAFTTDFTSPAGHFLQCTAFVVEEVEVDEEDEDEIVEWGDTVYVMAEAYAPDED